MTVKERMENMIKALDNINYEYIMHDRQVISDIESITRYSNDGRNELASVAIDRLLSYVKSYDQHHLTPANAKVGDGATVNLWTDRHAGTIVKVTKATITIRRDKATRSPDFKPEWVIGGFSAHCTNNNDQSWTYEPDENGELTTLHWSKKYNRYGQPGNLTASKGRHEFYDYNF